MDKLLRDQIASKTQYREIPIDRSLVNKETRTVPVAFSSEMPVVRWWGIEILSHDPGAVDFSRLKSGGPALMDHNPKDQIGRIQNPVLGADRVARAEIRFSKSARAEEVYQDVLDEIRTNISVGYDYLDLQEVSARDLSPELLDLSLREKKSVYMAKRWLPLEASIVSIPADSSVGVGREKLDDTQIIQTRSEKHMDEPVKTPEQMRAEIEAKVRAEHAKELADTEAAKATREKVEKERVDEIEAIAKQFTARVPNIDDIKESAIKLGVDAKLFRGTVYTRVTDRKPLDGPWVDLPEKDKNRYSITTAIRMMFKENENKPCLEREVHSELVKRIGHEPEKGGMYLSPEALFSTYARAYPERLIPQYRSNLVTTSTALGGALVGTQIVPGQFIDLLRNRMKTGALGVSMLTGLQQNIAIPKQTGAGTTYWVADDAAVTQSNPTFGQLTLNPHTVGAMNDYSRLLLIQSTPSVDALVVSDLVTIMSLAIDLAVLNGSGNAGQPTGILNWPSLTTNTDSTISWTKIVAHETDVATANADVDTMAWLMPAAVRGKLKTTVKVSGFPTYLMDDGGTVNGYRSEISNQMPAGTVLFGNWPMSVLAEWGILNMIVDPYTNSKSGTVRVVCFESVDHGVRQVGAFSAGTSATS